MEDTTEETQEAKQEVQEEEPEEELAEESDVSREPRLEEETETGKDVVEEEIFEEEEVEEIPSRRREEEEEEFVEERIYTIPLGRAWIVPAKKRAPKAMRIIKSFVQKHMKVGEGLLESEGEEAGKIIISNEVNEKIWSRGIEKPPRKLRVRVAKDDVGNVTVFLS